MDVIVLLMDPSSDISSLRIKSLNDAVSFVSAMLQTADQLHSVDHLIQTVRKNKELITNTLKASIDSHVNGVKVSLRDLKTSCDEITSLNIIVDEIADCCNDFQHVVCNVQQLKDLCFEYSKIVRSVDLLNILFNIPETVAKTKEFMAEGLFLNAHKNIIELEMIRDELLKENFRINSTDDNFSLASSPIWSYFKDVNKLSEELAKHICLILQRCLAVVHSKPSQIVSALRIIEREEIIDGHFSSQSYSLGHQYRPPSRPRRWRNMALNILKDMVYSRIESVTINAADNPHVTSVIISQLTLVGHCMLEDLKVIKSSLIDCFPSSYNIFAIMFGFYHSAVNKLISEYIHTNIEILKSEDCVSLIIWSRDYESPSLMGHPDFEGECLNFIKISIPVIDHSDVEILESKYVTVVSHNLRDWVTNMLNMEANDWRRIDVQPDSYATGLYSTSLPIILLQMIDENINVAKHIAQNVGTKVMDECLIAVKNFAFSYDKTVNEFINYYSNNTPLIDGREKIVHQYFTQYLGAIINNSHQIISILERIIAKRQPLYSNTIETNISSISDLFNQVSIRCQEAIINDFQNDIETPFSTVFTPSWIDMNGGFVNGLIDAIEGFCSFISKINHSVRILLFKKVDQLVAILYMKAALESHRSFTKMEERKQASRIITNEATRLVDMFKKLAKYVGTNANESNQEIYKSEKYVSSYVVIHLADILSASDVSMIGIDLGRLCDKYSDFTADHAAALLFLRGDVNKQYEKDILQFLQFGQCSDTFNGVFSAVKVNTSVMVSLQKFVRK